MEKTDKIVRIMKIAKWFGLIPGYIMYFMTREAFGEIAAAALAVAASVGFFIVFRNEETRQIGRMIVLDIKSAIADQGIESIIEIKKLKSGIIARVYLINARDKVILLNKKIAERVENSAYKKYIWVMQLTEISGPDEFKTTQNALNRQLLDEILKRKRENEEKKDK